MLTRNWNNKKSKIFENKSAVLNDSFLCVWFRNSNNWVSKSLKIFSKGNIKKETFYQYKSCQIVFQFGLIKETMMNIYEVSS